MNRVLVAVACFSLVLVLGLSLLNAEFHSIDENYSYENFLSDVQSESVVEVQMAVSSAPSRFEGNPRVSKILKALWDGEKVSGIKFSKAAVHPIVKIQVAESLLFMREAPRKVYVDYIYANLNSNDFERKRDAVRALGTVFDNNAVRKLNEIIRDQSQFSEIAFNELERMAIAAHSSENLALDVLKEIAAQSASDKALQKQAEEAIANVKAANDKFGSGARILTEPINSGDTYPGLYPYLEEDKRRIQEKIKS